MKQLPGKSITLPWELPVPSTSFVSGPELKDGRTSVLSWAYEGDSEFVKPPQDGMVHQALTFEGVVAFRCTFNLFCGSDIINIAYNKLVDLGETEWLISLKGASQRHHIGASESLKHVAIFFDEGPCYEFICEGVRVSTEVVPAK
jgi:hypothetical protein